MEPDDNNTHSFVALIAGTVVSHYRIVEKIGAGGMGEVYLAEDTQLDRKVALKFLPPHLSQDQDSRSRFTREAKAAAKLDHPNIAPVHEVGEFQGRPFFAMAHIEGQSLREVIKQGKLSTSEAIRLTMQICEGLHEAHSAGVVHRDIKPGNIIIDTKGRPRLLDFGLATVSGEEKLTKTGSTLGTVGYMAPEQIEGKDVDHRADLFSVGVILYEMLTGRRPFEGDNDAAVVKAITSSTPEPVARFKSGVTGELQQIVDKALAKDVSIRYQHADGMLADLKRLSLRDAPVRRSRLSLWVAASAVAVIVAGYFAYTAVFKKSLSVSGPKRLVVLPFDNLGDQEKDYFVRGMTDEIISKLSSLDNLKIIARQSAAKLKAKGIDISDIGKELGVEYVLDATVQWQESSSGASRVKLITRLIKVSDESVFWGKTYDTMMTEVFSVQSDMAEQVAEQLGVVLSPQEKQRVWEEYTDSQEAWDYYLRGNRYHDRGYYGSKEDMVLAVSMYQRAIEIDSAFARAYSRISLVFSRLYVTGRDRSDSCRVICREMAETAIELASLRPAGTGGHRALGYYYARFEEDWQLALKEWELAYGGKEKALSNPWFLWDAHMVMRYQGRWEETYEYMKKVVEGEPKQENAWFDLGVVCHFLRKYEEAEQYYRMAISLEPDFWGPNLRLSELYLDWQGDTKQAREVLVNIRSKVDTADHPSKHDIFRLAILDGNIKEARARAGEMDSDDIGRLYWALREIDTARMFFDSAVSEVTRLLASGPVQMDYYLGAQGRFYARLGNHDSAMHSIQKAIDFRPYSKDKLRGVDLLIDRFKVMVYLNELDSALAQADMLLSVPAAFDLGSLLIDPDYKELIKHSDFARLVREYGNEYHKRLYEAKVGPL